MKTLIGSYDLKINSESVLKNGIKLENFEIFYPIREIPTLSIELSGENFTNILSNNDFTFELTITDSRSFKFPFTLHHVKRVSERDILLVGFTATTEFMKTARTQYLGDNLTSALKKLVGNLDLRSLNSVNISGEFYQINETDYQAFLRLMKGVSSEYTWSMTESSINLISNNYIRLSTGTIESIEHNPVTVNKSEPVIDSNDYISQGWFKDNHIESSSKEWLTNAITACKKTKSYDIIIRMSYANFQDVQTGSKLEIDGGTFKVNKFDLIGKAIKGNALKISSEFVLGVNDL